jgi:hypothetical protein
MTEAHTLTHALSAEDKQNRVELRQSLRRTMRAQKFRMPFFGSKLEIGLFALAAAAILTTPLIRGSIKAKDDLIEVASRLRGPATPDDAIVTGSVTPARSFFRWGDPAKPTSPPPAPGKPTLRGTL